MEIRRATPKDAPTIAAYNIRMAAETEHKVLPEATVLSGVTRVFEDDRRGFYLVADVAGAIVGQLMITYEWSDWRDGWVWWIQSVYVHEDYRRQGVFRTLYAHIVAEAQAADDVVGLRLYVENTNHRAQQTYQQLGMVDAGYQVQEQMFGGAA